MFGLTAPPDLLGRIPYYAPLADPSFEGGLRITFINHSNLASYLAMVCCLGVGLALGERGAKRVLLTFLSAILALGVGLSLSRGGMVGLFGGLLVMAAFNLWHGRDRQQRLRTAGLLLAGTVVVLLALTATTPDSGSGIDWGPWPLRSRPPSSA